MFEIGQQVICISDNWHYRLYQEKMPYKGGIYTIRGFNNRMEMLGLFFEEIINPILPYDEGLEEVSFHSVSFRPVKKTSIEVFRNLLVSTPTKEREIA